LTLDGGKRVMARATPLDTFSSTALGAMDPAEAEATARRLWTQACTYNKVAVHANPERFILPHDGGDLRLEVWFDPVRGMDDDHLFN
jgi:hypothetical protein